MIKINLLPGYIVERRRVKALAILLGFILVIEALLLAAYLWAPGPFSLSTRYAKAVEFKKKAEQGQAEVLGLQAQAAATKASYEVKAGRVQYVDDADNRPAQFVAYFKAIARYFPADVVVNGLPLPSGITLNLSGSTNSLMSAARWYLNMLRCEMVAPNENAVIFTPGQFAVGSANPRMAMPVSISVQLKPEDLDFMAQLALPAGMTSGRGGRGGGRMGAAPGGGARGGRGGGRGGRGGGRGGRGGARGGMGGARGGMGGARGGRGGG